MTSVHGRESNEMGLLMIPSAGQRQQHHARVVATAALLLVIVLGAAPGQDLEWPQDYAAALLRARQETKPLFILIAWEAPG